VKADRRSLAFFELNHLGAEFADKMKMSTWEKTVDQKMAPAMEPATPAHLHREPSHAEKRQISPEVAHDLNNILTIIQAYSEIMLTRHRDNAALRMELQLIFDNTRRASSVVRQASVRNPSAVLIG
jgi:signal transduction histidine kinase